MDKTIIAVDQAENAQFKVQGLGHGIHGWFYQDSDKGCFPRTLCCKLCNLGSKEGEEEKEEEEVEEEVEEEEDEKTEHESIVGLAGWECENIVQYRNLLYSIVRV